jgi:hypothetical protein
MKFFKDANNNVFAYEADGSQDHLIGNKLPISEEEANALSQIKATAAFDALSYAQKRAASYPDFREYLDGIVKGDQAQIDAYKNACLAVKARYPKG